MYSIFTFSQIYYLKHFLRPLWIQYLKNQLEKFFTTSYFIKKENLLMKIGNFLGKII